MIREILDNLEALIKEQDIKQEISSEENQKFIRTIFDKLWDISIKMSDNGEGMNSKLNRIKSMCDLIRAIGERHQISTDETKETIYKLIREIESINMRSQMKFQLLKDMEIL
jgi:hypothetical protein